MTVSTSGGVACRVSFIQENGGHIEHVVKLAVDICTLALLFVADVTRDELFAGVQHMTFLKVVCQRQ